MMIPSSIYAIVVIKKRYLPQFFRDTLPTWQSIVSGEKVPPEPDNDEGAYNFYDGEILDEMTTSRGELKLITSFTCSSMEEC
ncbi:unnamed protein product [Prunus armeniaca]